MLAKPTNLAYKMISIRIEIDRFYWCYQFCGTSKKTVLNCVVFQKKKNLQLVVMSSVEIAIIFLLVVIYKQLQVTVI